MSKEVSALSHVQIAPEAGPVPEISVVIPLFNEEETLDTLYELLTKTLESLQRPYELIFVDDGSLDGSYQKLVRLYEADPQHVRIIQFRRNFGKTAALVVGFRESEGEVIITMDADLQDDPAEIPRLLDVLEQGYDLVVAWRQRRQDPLDKTLPSRLFNKAVATLTGVRLHDFNCGFKAYRREATEFLRLYGDLHRFIPVLVSWKGFRITEVPVVHHPRAAGQSKYGWTRYGRGLIDFLVVLFLTNYLRRPLQLFGGIGVLLFSMGFGIGAYLSVQWFLGFPIGWRPILFLAILAMIMGVQLASIGLLGEMIRNFAYDSADEYSIRRILR